MIKVFNKDFPAPIVRGFLFAMLFITACAEKVQRPALTEEAIQKEDIFTPLDTAGNIIKYFDSLHRTGQFNGVALFADGNRLTKFCMGKGRLQDEAPLQTTDVFQLASLSKPITALGILKLVDEKKLSLDEPLGNYLFEFPYPDLTLRSLLNHTSGLGNYIYVTDSLWARPDSFMANRDVYEIVRCGMLPIYYPPYTRFDYCNTNYALLPGIVEEVLGLPFKQFMNEEVFQPIGMRSTHYISPEHRNSMDYEVLGHYPNGRPKRPFYLDGVVGDKGLYSNVDDLFALYRELKNPTLISQDLVDQAMCPDVPVSQKQYYGLGWRIRPMDNGDTLVFHNGWWRGFRSYFWFSKRSDKVAIILTNSIRGGYLKQEEIWNLY